LENCFYLFSGKNISPQGDWTVISDTYVFNPTTHKRQVNSNGTDQEFKVMAGTAFPPCASSIIFASGSDGDLAVKEIGIKKRIVNLENQLLNGEDVGGILNLAKMELTGHLNND